MRVGHEVSTAADEGLKGAPDHSVAEVCRREGKVLITADLGFGQIIDYPPDRYPGLVVLRHPHPTLSGMEYLLRQVVAAIQTESPVGRLWIVEPGRIRVHDVTEAE